LAFYGLRLFILVLLLIGLSACKGNQDKNQGPQIGSQALNFSLQDLQGHTWTLDNCRGQVVLLRFWADWCPSCRFEMPVIDKQYRSLHPYGFLVLAVNVKQSAQVAEVFATQMNMSMPVLLDFKGDLSRQYRVVALPTNFMIDRQGIIREILIGEVFRDEKYGQGLLQKYFPKKLAPG
jgi:cytochrome c biogenesis protein CcmG, thiol:disulfide interchange protein DsbE